MAVKRRKSTNILVRKAGKGKASVAALNGFVLAAPLKDELLRVRKMLVLHETKRQSELTAWSEPSRTKAARYAERQVARISRR